MQFQILHCISLDFLFQTSDFGPIPLPCLCEVRQSALIEAIPGGFAHSAVENSLWVWLNWFTPASGNSSLN